jgi:rhodanese-related sulfurtransferase
MKKLKWMGTGMAVLALLAALPVQAADQVPSALEAADLQQMIQRGEKLSLINSMSPLECMDRSIPGSLCIAGEEFGAKAPQLLPDKSSHLVFYCESNRSYRSNEAAAMALKAGYRQVSVLNGGMPAWKRAGYGTVSKERIPRLPCGSVKPERLARWFIEKRDLLILDVRGEDRFTEDHLPGAINIPLYRLHGRYQEIPLDRPVLVVDDRGLRSFLVASYLLRKGIGDVVRLFGGMERWHAYLAPGKNRP